MRILIKHFALLFNAIVYRDTSPKVVFYHDIGQEHTPMGTAVELFEAHIALLKKVKVEGEGEQRTVIPYEVAFDDGFRGIWDYRELLRKYDVHPVVFLAVGLVGQPGYLTWDEIRTLQDDYGVNFQCHTWSHQTLIGPVNTDLPIPEDPNFRTKEWYRHELVDSKNELERQLNLGAGGGEGTGGGGAGGKTVDSICFPVGYFSDDVVRRCIAAGYTKLFASFPGNKDDTNSTVHLHLQSTPNDATCRIIPRCLCQFLSLADFKLVLKGGMNPMRGRYLRMHYIK